MSPGVASTYSASAPENFLPIGAKSTAVFRLPKQRESPGPNDRKEDESGQSRCRKNRKGKYGTASFQSTSIGLGNTLSRLPALNEDTYDPAELMCLNVAGGSVEKLTSAPRPLPAGFWRVADRLYRSTSACHRPSPNPTGRSLAGARSARLPSPGACGRPTTVSPGSRRPNPTPLCSLPHGVAGSVCPAPHSRRLGPARWLPALAGGTRLCGSVKGFDSEGVHPRCAATGSR